MARRIGGTAGSTEGGDTPEGAAAPTVTARRSQGPWTRAETGARLRRWAVAAAPPLGLYVASRLIIVLSAELVLWMHRAVHSTWWPTTPPGRPLSQLLGSWDGSWYIWIANQGYITQYHPLNPYVSGVSFFPLLPLIIRATSAVTGLGPLNAGLLAAFLTGAAASVCIWAAVRDFTDEGVANRTVALWVFFPGALFLTMVYAEGLLAACAAVCVLALHKRRWVVAGVAAGLATATHPDGFVLIACCAWAAGWAVAERRQWRALIAVVLAPLGFVAYSAYLWNRTGDMFFWYRIEHDVWGDRTHVYQSTIGLLIHTVQNPGRLNTNLVPALGLAVAVIGILFMCWARLPAVMIIYAAGVILVAWSAARVGVRPRFLLAAFPLFIPLGMRLRGPALNALIGCAAAATVLLAVVELSSLAITP